MDDRSIGCRSAISAAASAMAPGMENRQSRQFIAPYSKDFLQRLLNIKDKRQTKESVKAVDIVNNRGRYDEAFQVSQAKNEKMHHSIVSFSSKMMHNEFNAKNKMQRSLSAGAASRRQRSLGDDADSESASSRYSSTRSTSDFKKVNGLLQDEAAHNRINMNLRSVVHEEAFRQVQKPKVWLHSGQVQEYASVSHHKILNATALEKGLLQQAYRKTPFWPSKTEAELGSSLDRSSGSNSTNRRSRSATPTYNRTSSRSSASQDGAYRDRVSSNSRAVSDSARKSDGSVGGPKIIENNAYVATLPNNNPIKEMVADLPSVKSLIMRASRKPRFDALSRDLSPSARSSRSDSASRSSSQGRRVSTSHSSNLRTPISTSNAREKAPQSAVNIDSHFSDTERRQQQREGSRDRGIRNERSGDWGFSRNIAHQNPYNAESAAPVLGPPPRTKSPKAGSNTGTSGGARGEGYSFAKHKPVIRNNIVCPLSLIVRRENEPERRTEGILTLSKDCSKLEMLASIGRQFHIKSISDVKIIYNGVYKKDVAIQTLALNTIPDVLNVEDFNSLEVYVGGLSYFSSNEEVIRDLTGLESVHAPVPSTHTTPALSFLNPNQGQGRGNSSDQRKSLPASGHVSPSNSSSQGKIQEKIPQRRFSKQGGAFLGQGFNVGANPNGANSANNTRINTIINNGNNSSNNDNFNSNMTDQNKAQIKGTSSGSFSQTRMRNLDMKLSEGVLTNTYDDGRPIDVSLVSPVYNSSDFNHAIQGFGVSQGEATFHNNSNNDNNDNGGGNNIKASNKSSISSSSKLSPNDKAASYVPLSPIVENRHHYLGKGDHGSTTPSLILSPYAFNEAHHKAKEQASPLANHHHSNIVPSSTSSNSSQHQRATHVSLSSVLQNGSEKKDGLGRLTNPNNGDSNSNSNNNNNNSNNNSDNRRDGVGRADVPSTPHLSPFIIRSSESAPSSYDLPTNNVRAILQHPQLDHNYQHHHQNSNYNSNNNNNSNNNDNNNNHYQQQHHKSFKLESDRVGNSYGGNIPIHKNNQHDAGIPPHISYNNTHSRPNRIPAAGDGRIVPGPSSSSSSSSVASYIDARQEGDGDIFSDGYSFHSKKIGRGGITTDKAHSDVNKAGGTIHQQQHHYQQQQHHHGNSSVGGGRGLSNNSSLSPKSGYNNNNNNSNSNNNNNNNNNNNTDNVSNNNNNNNYNNYNDAYGDNDSSNNNNYNDSNIDRPPSRPWRSQLNLAEVATTTVDVKFYETFSP